MKTYKNLDTWAKAMRKDKQKKLWADWFKIGGHWYTCEEYDHNGKYMRYTSITAREHVDLDTSNRYSDSWLSDLEITEYPIEDLRFDISYYMPPVEEQDKKMIMLLNIWLWDRQMYKEIRDLVDYMATYWKGQSHD